MADDKASFRTTFGSVSNDVTISFPCTIKDYVNKLESRADSIKNIKTENERIEKKKEEIASIIESMVDELEESFPVKFQDIDSLFEDDPHTLSITEIATIRRKFKNEDEITDKYAIPNAILSMEEIPAGDLKEISELLEILSKIDTSVRVGSIDEIIELVYPTPKAEPTSKPKAEPTSKPKAEPTSKPKTEPTSKPKAEPTSKPKTEPTSKPETKPVAIPSAKIIDVIEELPYCTYEENGHLHKKTNPSAEEKGVRTYLWKREDGHLITRYTYVNHICHKRWD